MQVGGIAILFVCIFLWIVVFFEQGLKASRMPAFGSSYGSVLSVVIFNFGYVMTVPSWLNEKKANVSIKKTVTSSVIIANTLFLALGILGGLSLDYPNGEDLLAAIDNLGHRAVRIALNLCPFNAVKWWPLLGRLPP